MILRCLYASKLRDMIGGQVEKELDSSDTRIRMPLTTFPMIMRRFPIQIAYNIVNVVKPDKFV